jgi:benzoate/toluate 1,2-dioxygenase subunit beta
MIERSDVEAFLFQEARLLDERRFRDWEALWADDAVYWVPAEHGDYDPAERVSVIYDDRRTLAKRVERLCGPDAHAEQPPASVRRLISNVEVSDGDGDVIVESNFMAVTSRGEREGLWGGHVTHRLRRDNGDWRMSYKKVELVNCASPLTHLPFLP